MLAVSKRRVYEIAKELGNAKAANIVALAAFAVRSDIVHFYSLKDEVKDKFAQTIL